MTMRKNVLNFEMQIERDCFHLNFSSTVKTTAYIRFKSMALSEIRIIYNILDCDPPFKEKKIK